ncbi:MAG: phospholipid carrier-dependent glycosyltransferase, partial [Armatimonadetes bacterium]|nr:phospholipid carrier-dependent glycosyltransferase [Armatimonadota bacterium]
SAGLLTDEGFYIHNARNMALFGQARTDEFNNMLLAPVLHFVQVVVFRTAGVGSVQARMISVICSLAAMLLLWSALNRLYGRRVAWIATMLLGLDHTSLLFSRMALMDPFASLGAVLAFRLFVAAREPEARRSALLYALSGLAIGATVLNRSICAYLLPAPFIAAALGGADRRAHGALAVGLATALGLWLVAWWAPNRAEITRVTRYYRVDQVQPRSFGHLMSCLKRGAVGDHRGISPYLFRHTPVMFGLALAFLAAGLLRCGPGRQPNQCGDAASRSAGVSPASGGSPANDRSAVPDAGETPALREAARSVSCPGNRTTVRWSPRNDDSGDAQSLARRSGTAYLAAWLGLGWLAISASAYSPTRYYVTTYPALAGIAALAYGRLPEIIGRLGADGLAARGLRGGLCGFLIFHAAGAIVHRGGVVGPLATSVALYVLPFAVGLAVAVWRPSPRRTWAVLAGAAPAIWAGANGWWLTDWLRHLRYTQHETSTRLGRILPRDSVLIGDVAPGLCMDNRLRAINVIPGLCNGVQPVERFAGRPRFVVILDGRWKERYWLDAYPELVLEDRRVLLQRVLRWDIGVYPVPEADR